MNRGQGIAQEAPEPKAILAKEVKEIELISFRKVLTALEKDEIFEDVSFDGYVIEVQIHWPDNCDALVDVAVFHNNKQFCPRDEYLALNNVTPRYTFNRPVNQGDDLWVKFRSRDGSSPHTITVTISVREK